jgi:hypothetical protein
MKEIARMRLGILREFKSFRKLLDNIEKRVKERDPEYTQRAYIFLKTLVVMMNDGELSPDKVAMNLQLQRKLENIE